MSVATTDKRMRGISLVHPITGLFTKVASREGKYYVCLAMASNYADYID